MKLSEKELNIIKNANSADELIKLAKAAGIKANDEAIKAKYDAMHCSGSLSDEELENVSGGNCDTGSDENTEPKHAIKSRLVCLNKSCMDYNEEWTYDGDVREHSTKYVCPACGQHVWVCWITDVMTQETYVSEQWLD